MHTTKFIYHRAKWIWLCLVLVGSGCSSCFDRSQSAQEIKRSAPVHQPAIASPTKAPAEPSSRVREAQFAGSWYFEEKEKLIPYLDRLFAQADPAPSSIKGNILALISPHAGYAYSGKAAAAGFQLLRGRDIRRVIILAVPHHVLVQGAVLDDATHFRTPLGLIPGDLAAADRLRQRAVVHNQPEAFQQEHSIEIQLPLLQRVLPQFTLVPLLIGQMSDQDYIALAQALAEVVDPHTLVVASSDFTHRGSNYGFELPSGKGTIKERLAQMDQGSLKCIQNLNRTDFLAYVNKTGTTICGAHAIALLLELLSQKAQQVKSHLISQYTSGDVTGDWTSTVSYFDMAFTGEWPNRMPLNEARNAGASVFPLTETEKQALLRLARSSLEASVRKGQYDPEVLRRLPPLVSLKRKAGAFVTLKCKQGPNAVCISQGEELRGCIGTIMPLDSVYETVAKRAASAALEDTRFPRQVSPAELKHITIEISVLTPPRTVKGAEEIIIGRHGIILTKAGSSATFLPQVAPEQGWDRETTLNHLAIKAGLAADDWRQGAQFAIYEAIVFKER